VITAGTTTPAAWSDGQSGPADDHLQRGGRLPHGDGCRCVVAPAGSPDRGAEREARTPPHADETEHRHTTKVAAWQAANAGTTGLRWVTVRRFFAKEALPVATAPLRASTVPVMPPTTPPVPTSGRHSVRRPAEAVRAALGVGGTGLLLSGRRAKGQPATQGACSTPTQPRPPTAWRRTLGTATPSHCPPSGVLELPTPGARFVLLEVAGAQAEKNRLSPSG